MFLIFPDYHDITKSFFWLCRLLPDRIDLNISVPSVVKNKKTICIDTGKQRKTLHLYTLDGYV